LPSEGLFGPIFVPPAVAATVNDKVWLQALLDVEAALAAAEAEHGLVPPEAAQAIADACICDEYDLALLGQAAVAGGNPVIPLVRAMMRRLPPAAAPYVHLGATSQDILDTATSVVLRQALATMLAELAAVAAACDGLAGEHRRTPMVGRTLLQPAVPITFGLKAAGWLAAVTDAHEGLRRVATTRLAVQLGGPAGTLGVLGDRGAVLADALADRLGLARAPLARRSASWPG
jgi:3-carboxy-cis,cis-muconate cycloisomerase